MTERASAAQAMIAIPLFYALLQEQEAAAVNRILDARDHDARQAETANLRAIRNFRSRIEAISQEGQPIERKAAPA